MLGKSTMHGASPTATTNTAFRAAFVGCGGAGETTFTARTARARALRLARAKLNVSVGADDLTALPQRLREAALLMNTGDAQLEVSKGVE